MGHRRQEMYIFVNEWDKWCDLKCLYACVYPEHWATSLEIRSDWFTKDVGDELGKIYTCHIAELSTDDRQFCMIGAPHEYQGSGSM